MKFIFLFSLLTYTGHAIDAQKKIDCSLLISESATEPKSVINQILSLPKNIDLSKEAALIEKVISISRTNLSYESRNAKSAIEALQKLGGHNVLNNESVTKALLDMASGTFIQRHQSDLTSEAEKSRLEYAIFKEFFDNFLKSKSPQFFNIPKKIQAIIRDIDLSPNVNADPLAHEFNAIKLNILRTLAKKGDGTPLFILSVLRGRYDPDQNGIYYGLPEKESVWTSNKHFAEHVIPLFERGKVGTLSSYDRELGFIPTPAHTTDYGMYALPLRDRDENFEASTLSTLHKIILSKYISIDTREKALLLFDEIEEKDLDKDSFLETQLLPLFLRQWKESDDQLIRQKAQALENKWNISNREKERKIRENPELWTKVMEFREKIMPSLSWWGYPSVSHVLPFRSNKDNSLFIESLIAAQEVISNAAIRIEIRLLFIQEFFKIYDQDIENNFFLETQLLPSLLKQWKQSAHYQIQQIARDLESRWKLSKREKERMLRLERWQIEADRESKK